MLGSTDPVALGLDPALAGAGFNLAGVLSPADYDARVDPVWRSRELLPTASSVVVLATGGSAFYRAARRSGLADDDPLDRFLSEIVAAGVAFERSQGFAAAGVRYFESRAGHFADFVALGQAAGLGSPSRLALLIHPEFGPWFAIRALLLTERVLAPTRPDPGFRPCEGCPAPCEAACPGKAVSRRDFDLSRCLATTRRLPDCQIGCAARRACIVGPTHHYDSEAEAHHRRAALEFGGE